MIEIRIHEVIAEPAMIAKSNTRRPSLPLRNARSVGAASTAAGAWLAGTNTGVAGP